MMHLNRLISIGYICDHMSTEGIQIGMLTESNREVVKLCIAKLWSHFDGVIAKELSPS